MSTGKPTIGLLQTYRCLGDSFSNIISPPPSIFDLNTYIHTYISNVKREYVPQKIKFGSPHPDKLAESLTLR